MLDSKRRGQPAFIGPRRGTAKEELVVRHDKESLPARKASPGPRPPFGGVVITRGRKMPVRAIRRNAWDCVMPRVAARCSGGALARSEGRPPSHPDRPRQGTTARRSWSCAPSAPILALAVARPGSARSSLSAYCRSRPRPPTVPSVGARRRRTGWLARSPALRMMPTSPASPREERLLSGPWWQLQHSS